MPQNKQALKTFCTTREAATLLSVSLRTAQLWTESGLLEAWKTEGGHRRISRQSIENLLAESPARMVAENPEPVALNVLVVEDNPLLRRLYEVNLRRWPMPVELVTAEDGYEALIRLGHKKPDLLIADLQMPGMDGFRMLHTLAGMPEFSSMKIIVVSGLSPEEIATQGGIPSGISIFPKPIPFGHLQHLAAQTLANLNLTPVMHHA